MSDNQPGTKMATQVRPARVLVIDDEPLIIETLSRALRRRHQVTALESAVDALAVLIGGARFDVILCDLMMPQLTGQELFERLSEVSFTQAARMVFVTGGALTRGAETFLRNATHPPLYKPFGVAEVLETIDRVLQLQKSVNGNRSTGNIRTIRR
jgi:two-component system NtrC family sensor kinase